ncbi:hypothetical protein QE368_001716 [Asaia bogorensis NBRC 16594]|nr:hypothetical protein [Asaia bogorensis NBRC 16594]
MFPKIVNSFFCMAFRSIQYFAFAVSFGHGASREQRVPVLPYAAGLGGLLQENQQRDGAGDIRSTVDASPSGRVRMTAEVANMSLEIREAKAQRRLRYRMIAMVVGVLMFHVCLAWAIAGTSVDMQDHFHTNYWALGATLFWAMYAVYNMSVS